MINYCNKTSFHIDSRIIDFLTLIKNDVCVNEVELVIVNDDEIKQLNRDFLAKDDVTDVLSFGINYTGLKIKDPPLGSIVISIDMALKITNIYKHSLKEELAILFTHALLHLLGFDHEIDNGEHRDKENEILNKFGISNSLINRALLS